jgi:hypothetical protein
MSNTTLLGRALARTDEARDFVAALRAQGSEIFLKGNRDGVELIGFKLAAMPTSGEETFLRDLDRLRVEIHALLRNERGHESAHDGSFCLSCWEPKGLAN